MLGDGCEKCNPELALEYAKETITDLEQQRNELLEALKEALKPWKKQTN